jgi:hypothetical protein
VLLFLEQNTVATVTSTYDIYYVYTVMLEYCRSRLFSEGIPINSVMALANEDFRVAGELMAMSIVQGGPGPYLFSSVIYNIISKDLAIEDCKSSFIKDTCQKVCQKLNTLTLKVL